MESDETDYITTAGNGQPPKNGHRRLAGFPSADRRQTACSAALAADPLSAGLDAAENAIANALSAANVDSITGQTQSGLADPGSSTAASPDSTTAQGNDPHSGLIDELNGDAALRNAQAMLSSVDGGVSASGSTALNTGGSTYGQASSSPFVGLALGFVGTTTFSTAVAFSAWAATEMPAAISGFMSVGGEVALIGSASAIGDIGGMAFVGASLGAGGGVVLLAPLGAGYALGSAISPWVNSNIIDPYLYPLLGLPKY